MNDVPAASTGQPRSDCQDLSIANPMHSGRTPSLSFRPMTLEDLDRVHAIDILSFNLPWPVKSFRFELTENPTSLALVAEIEGSDGKRSVIGMSVVWILVDEAHIATIAIHPDCRGHGIGKKLLAETLCQAIQRGATSATLEVRSSNFLAQDIYRKFGFTIVGRRPHYYHDNNEDAVLMTVNKLGSEYLTWLKKFGV